jgi:hypothetical protein
MKIKSLQVKNYHLSIKGKVVFSGWAMTGERVNAF